MHNPHFEHFSWSKTGLKTRHEPVLLSRDFPGFALHPTASAT